MMSQGVAVAAIAYGRQVGQETQGVRSVASIRCHCVSVTLTCGAVVQAAVVLASVSVSVVAVAVAVVLSCVMFGERATGVYRCAVPLVLRMAEKRVI